MELVLKVEDTNVSPVIDTDRISVVTTTNRVNRPVTNYVDDNRVTDKSDRDPNQAVYISKRVDLENPASFLQVKLAGHQPPGSDFRVLYKLFRPDTIDEEQPYELFPGFANLTDTTGDGLVIELKILAIMMVYLTRKFLSPRKLMISETISTPLKILRTSLDSKLRLLWPVLIRPRCPKSETCEESHLHDGF